MSYGNEGVNLTMPVEPSGYGNNNGFGFGGDNGWWILLLFLFGMNGGWGNNGGYGGGGLYPWMNQADVTTSGFQNQMLNTQLMGIQNGITAGFGDVQNALCGGFAGVNANISNGFAQAEIGENARQMANMQQMFGIQSALQQCCCDNRAGIADLKFTVAQENCADRAAVSDGIRDVIANQTANTQAVLDKLCALELDGYKRLRRRGLRGDDYGRVSVQCCAGRPAQPGRTLQQLYPLQPWKRVSRKRNGDFYSAGPDRWMLRAVSSRLLRQHRHSRRRDRRSHRPGTGRERGNAAHQQEHCDACGGGAAFFRFLRGHH